MATKFLTKEGFQKLQDELDHLKTVKRQEVADRLHEAMEGGELIENAEYEAAKNEQAFVEGRIQELEMLLATARVIEPEAGSHADRCGGRRLHGDDPGTGLRRGDVHDRGGGRGQPARGQDLERIAHRQGDPEPRGGRHGAVETPSGTYKVKIIKVK